MRKQHKEPSPAFTAARELAKKIGRMSDQERAAFVARFPTVVTVEGHELSAHNACMAITQRDGVTIVGGFKQWLKAGRCVAKGSAAIWIYAPCQAKSDEDDGESKMFFRLVPVFDVSQTAELEQQEAPYSEAREREHDRRHGWAA